MFGRSPLDMAVRRFYSLTVEQSRQPGFYSDWGVPDSPIGRFDVIALHGFFVLHRLKGEAQAVRFSEAFCGAIFDDMDRNLREMGVGDLSVGKKVRKLAEGFYGRAEAYERALMEDDRVLRDVLAKNLYGDASADEKALFKVTDYVRRNVDFLATQEVEKLVGGRINFAPLEQGTA